MRRQTHDPDVGARSRSQDGRDASASPETWRPHPWWAHRPGKEVPVPAGLVAEEARALRHAGLTLGDEMGSGARGPVLRCLDGEGRDVVLRCLDLPEGRAGAVVLRRLADLRQLRHPGIVPVRDVVALPGQRVAMVVDLVPGADLAVVLGARGHLEGGELATLLDGVGSALAHLHEHGAVHGDVAPGNVVVTPEGRPVLVDLVGGVREEGTAGYAAPERVGGGPPTAATDVYALAALVAASAVRSGAWAGLPVAPGTDDGRTGGTTVAGEVLDRVLGDALATRPEGRPTARDLAARAPELGRDTPIALPDGARLAAGALRAAAAAPTRAVARRRRVPGRSGAGTGPVGVGQGRRLGDRVPSGRAVAGRRAVLGIGAVLVLGALAAGPLRPVLAAGAGAAGAGGTSGSSGPGAGTPSAAVSPPADTGGVGTDQATLREAVVDLAGRRDEALEAGNASSLAATTVEGSPARAADDAVLAGLVAAGETVSGLNSEVRTVSVVEVPADAAAAWPGAAAVHLTLAQAASTRSGPSGTRTVPAVAAREVVLVLVPGPWRVAEVRACEE